jgi:protein-arginine kinase activator protein McsA
MTDGYNEPYCRNCGLTESEFNDGFYLGCSECYKYLRRAVSVVTAETQGTLRHVGRVPKVSPNNPELLRLTYEYKRAVSFNRTDDAEKLAYRIIALGGNLNDL